MKKNILMLLAASLACLFVTSLAFAAEATAVALPAMANVSLLDTIIANKAVLLAALLALSEVLALIPGIKANSIFQLVVNGLKSMVGNQTTSSGR